MAFFLPLCLVLAVAGVTPFSHVSSLVQSKLLVGKRNIASDRQQGKKLYINASAHESVQFMQI